MSDELIVRHCSPTLAGMKTGSLFSCSYCSNGELTDFIRRLNKRLTPKGLRAVLLRKNSGRALIYFYRPDRLSEDFSKKSVQQLLEKLGYDNNSPELCIVKLISKLKNQDEFPHEIGLFLGYPVEDVLGFIKNKAACSKCTGCWKVYGDVQKARKTFEKYKKCTDVYCAQWKSGKSIEKLAVASLQ